MGRKHELQAVEGDMTPMIDVVFQLIIFFMTTIRFKALEGKLETELPRDIGGVAARHSPELLKAEIGLHADASRAEGFSVTLNGRKLPSLVALRARLAALKHASPEMQALLAPGRGVEYSHVIQVVDECIKARMLDVTFTAVAFDE
jgi:biopolymer transport protein ExbD